MILDRENLIKLANDLQTKANELDEEISILRNQVNKKNEELMLPGAKCVS